MSLPANLNVYISAAVFVIGAYIFALYAGLIVWTVRDMRRRSRDVMAQIMAILLVALFTLPGLLVYMLLRPQTTLAEEYERNLAEESLLQGLDEKRVCPSCQRHVEPEFVVCPHCHQQLRLRCVGCGRLLNPDWDVCPYCGLYREQDESKPSKGQRKAGRAADKPAEPVQVVPQMPAPVVVAEVVEVEDLLPSDYGDEPAGEVPHIDAAEVTRRLDEIAAGGAPLLDPLEGDADDTDEAMDEDTEEETV